MTYLDIKTGIIFLLYLLNHVSVFGQLNCLEKSLAFNNKTIFIDSTNVEYLSKTSIVDAEVDKEQPFCAKIEKGFYIQINLSDVTTIKTVYVQGGTFNGRGLLLDAFILQFSYDGLEWFNYFDESFNTFKYFLVSYLANGDTNKKLQFQLSTPAFGRFMRLVPTWPKSQIYNPYYELCLRLKVISCSGILPPSFETTEIHYAKPELPSIISCNVLGQTGIHVWWDGFNNTIKTTESVASITPLQVQLKTNLTIKLAVQNLEDFICTKDTENGLLCLKMYICRASYPVVWNSSWTYTTKVYVQIRFPGEIENFSVLGKNATGVTLTWVAPNLYDLTSDMVEYLLTCNASTIGSENTLLFGQTTVFLPVSLKYARCRCTLNLRVKDTSYKYFPHQLKMSPKELYFQSFAARPNVKPEVNVTQVTAHNITIRVTAKLNQIEYGVLTNYIIRGEMKTYGGRIAALYPLKFKTLNGDTVCQRSMVEKSLAVTPWSVYIVSVTVVNNDGLSSDTSSMNISTREGVPTAGPLVKIFTHSSNTITFEIQEIPFVSQHGEIIFYTCFSNETKLKITASPLTPYILKHLRPYTSYHIKCRAHTSAGAGPYGEVCIAMTDEDFPGLPGQIQILPATDTSNLLLRWTPPDPANGKIDRYEVRIILVNKTQVNKFTKASDRTIFDVGIPARDVNQVSIRAYTGKGFGQWKKAQVNAQTTGAPVQDRSDNIVIIVTFSVAIVILLGLVILCFIYYKRRFTSSHHAILKDISMVNLREQTPSQATYPDDIGDDHYLLGNEDETRDRTVSLDTAERSLVDHTHEPIPADQFANYVNEIKRDDNELLLDEFRNQLMSGKCYSWQIAVRPENRPKNRYANIAAYDHSRIILHHDSKRKMPDYINANTFKGYKFGDNGSSNYRYISTQGPLENTFSDFWLMVWQENVDIIVMVTNLTESDKIKCGQYWPSSGSIKYGSLVVTIQKIDKTADTNTRTFLVEKPSTKEQRTVLQLHFVSWPDHGVPDYPTSILSLRKRVRHYTQENRPILVHCSAGVGRTGCFILIDAMLEQIDNEGTVEIFNYLRYLRSRRINMVQTFEQYVFAHTAILEYITFGNTEIVVNDLDKKTRELIRGNGMQEEFLILKRNTQPDLPYSNHFKVLLREGKFVNAFRVDGYKHRDAFILMTAPTEETCTDFWKMVLEKQCHTVVMLNKCQEDIEEYFKYWPGVDGDCVHRDMTVSMNSEVANGNIITRKIKVTTNKQRCEVHHFQYVDWPDTDVPHRRAYSNLCTLMQAVEKSQQILGNGPIIVHAGNDYGRSGTFIAIYNSIERLKVEQLIDVLQCVRAIRIAQPHAVDNVAQYQFIYNMLRTYLEGFERYWNYKDYKVCRSPLGSTTSADGAR